MAKRGGGAFRFRKTDHIGAADAEHDTEYLQNCFVDTGDLRILEDESDHRQILLGRAGSGKSALLEKLKWSHGEQVIAIEPENLALTYVSNSTVLQFFSDLGVNLDPFFKLLWRHVLTVEILNRHLASLPTVKSGTLLDKLRSMFCGTSKKDREMNEAIKYLQDWGEHFWEQTEFRVKEIARKLEDSLGEVISAELGVPTMKANEVLQGTRKMTEEQKAEIVTRGQRIVSEAQVQDLHKVIRLLDAVLEDRQKQYYVVIDKLDENWVEERLRYKLIMALIQTARDFFSVRNAKILIAIRRDLIERVFRITRESGFQEEKFQSLYLPLYWSKEDLIRILDTRIDALVTGRYTKKSVTHGDLLPKKFKKTSITKYIHSITERPRDIIALFNACILAGANLSKLTSTEFKEAEGEYSRGRLRALGDEWSSNYPAVLDFARILQRRPTSFKLKAIADDEINDLCLELASNNPGGEGILQQYAMRVVDLVTAASDFRIFLFQVFYRVGLVGLKLTPHESASWADELGKSVSVAEINLETSAVVHPMYHRVLGINSRS